ncbi:hypothetical protein Tco_1165563 [Tanacetum coccineum]
MRNNIMAAGSKDRPPMLGPGRYSQWRSHFLRYIDTKANGEYLRKCIFDGPYKLTSVVIKAVAATVNAPAVPEHDEAETIHNMSEENKLYFKAEKEAIFLLLTGIGDEIYSTFTSCDGESMESYYSWNKLLSSTKTSKNYATSSSTRPSASTRHKGKEIAKPVTPQSESVSEEDSDPEQAQRDKDMQKNLALLAKNQDWKIPHQGINNDNQSDLDTMLRNVEPKRVKDYTYHKEKMMMCKQAEHKPKPQGLPLQEVLPEESSSTHQPLEQIQNQDKNNVFANER